MKSECTKSECTKSGCGAMTQLCTFLFHYRIYSENHSYEDFASFSVTFEGKNYLIHRYK